MDKILVLLGMFRGYPEVVCVTKVTTFDTTECLAVMTGPVLPVSNVGRLRALVASKRGASTFNTILLISIQKFVPTVWAFGRHWLQLLPNPLVRTISFILQES